MEVSCPNCAFTRHVPEDKLPATAVMATCPRCKTRFAFRERVAAPVGPADQALPGQAEQAQRTQAAASRVVEPARSAAASPAPEQPPQQPERVEEPRALYDREGEETQQDVPAHARTDAPSQPEVEAREIQDHDESAPQGPSVAQAPAAEPARPAKAQPAEPRPEPEPEPEPEPARKPDIWSRLSAMGQAGHRPEPEAAARADAPRAANAREDEDSPWPHFDKLKGRTPEQAVNLFSDMRGILTAPARFFSGPGLARGLKDALLFNLVVSEFVVVAHFLGAILGLRGTMFSADNPFLPADLPAALPLTFLMMLLVVPFSIVMGALAGSGLTHVLLLAFRMAKGGFATTFRVVCYSTAPTIFTVLPLFASFLPPPARVILVFGIVVWQMTLEVLGLSKSHQAALPQTVAAVLGKWTFFILVLGVLAGNTLG